MRIEVLKYVAVKLVLQEVAALTAAMAVVDCKQVDVYEALLH